MTVYLYLPAQGLEDLQCEKSTIILKLGSVIMSWAKDQGSAEQMTFVHTMDGKVLLELLGRGQNIVTLRTMPMEHVSPSTPTKTRNGEFFFSEQFQKIVICYTFLFIHTLHHQIHVVWMCYWSHIHSGMPYTSYFMSFSIVAEPSRSSHLSLHVALSLTLVNAKSCLLKKENANQKA